MDNCIRNKVMEELLSSLWDIVAKIKKESNDSFDTLIEVEGAIAAIHKEYEYKSGKFCDTTTTKYRKEKYGII